MTQRHPWKYTLLKSVIMFLIASIFTSGTLSARTSDYNIGLYYFYEVSNPIYLSDFELGSDGSIRDSNGHGFGVSYVIREGNALRLELDLGFSQTVYKGAYEDGVTVTFEPTPGSGFEALSSSTNVIYDFDVEFQNPYIGIAFVLGAFRFGGGRFLQTAKGGMTLKSAGSEFILAEMIYDPQSQFYGFAGAEFEMDGITFGASYRIVEAPLIIVTSCNTLALGSTVCSRISSVSGNRNLRSNTVGEGILYITMLF